MTTPILQDRSLLVAVSVILVVVIIGMVVIVVAGGETAQYVLFVTGPLISTVVGLALTHQVKTVQGVAETVSAQVAAVGTVPANETPPIPLG